MTQKPIFKGITQIGLVVKSVEATAQRCWEELGIGPWTFYTFDPAKQDSKVEDMVIRGKRVDHAMGMGHAMVGDIDWEIIEPLDDKSLYAEHLKQHGEGIFITPQGAQRKGTWENGKRINWIEDPNEQ